MNIQRKNSAHHFHMQSEREQTFSKEKAFKINANIENVGLNED